MLRVLLITRDEYRRLAWRRVLKPLDVTLWCGDELPQHAPVDLVVSDQELSSTSYPLHARAAQNGELGVVLVDADGPADVQLPADHADRELQLACRLLGEVIQLRRQQREQQERTEQFDELAHTDPLTELPNRRGWERELAKRLVLPWNEQQVVVALVDLDHFKQVNSMLGHAGGDEVLRTAAVRLRGAVRQGDVLARLGGDEFALLLPNVPEEASLKVVDRIRRAVGAAADELPRVSASAGCCHIASSPNPSDLLNLADRALRQAKQQGRDQTCSC